MSDTVFLGTVVGTTPSMLFEDDATYRVSELLASAEGIIFEECCKNGCVSYGEKMGGHPTRCPLFYPTAEAPLSCCVFMLDKGGEK